MGRFIKIAYRNITSHKTRSTLLGGSIALVTALMIVLFALVNGIQQTMIEGGTTLSSGHVNISGFFKISQSSASPLVTDFPKLEKLAWKIIPEATRIIHRVKGWGKVISDSSSLQLPIWGVDPSIKGENLGGLPLAKKSDYLPSLADTPEGERRPGNMQQLSKSGTLAVFASHAKKLGVEVGDSVTVSMPTYRNISNTKDLTIAAILKDQGMMSSWTVFANADDIREIYQISQIPLEL